MNHKNMNHKKPERHRDRHSKGNRSPRSGATPGSASSSTRKHKHKKKNKNKNKNRKKTQGVAKANAGQ